MIPKFRFILVLVMTGLLHYAHAQPSTSVLKGMITDSITGEEIIFANFILKDTKGVMITRQIKDLFGAYTIKHLEAGTYTIEVKHIGYETIVR